MFDLIEEAKKNKQAVVFRNYEIPNITWEDVLLFLYKESLVTNHNLEKKVKEMNNFADFNSIGNIQIQNKFWLSPQNHNIFKDFNGVSELLYKLNNFIDNSHCEYYNDKTCSCSSDWHFQGIRISLSNRLVSDHHDPHDIFYWQILGTSFWKVDNDITYTLNPGDLLYLPLENSHEVWCDGPRAGLLIDNLN
jgi:mannose-6-phosphate isomerase-like protein (cupin superfamily)